MKKEQYYLIDLKLSIGTTKVHYLKQNATEYTQVFKEAGLFSLNQATDIVNKDLDNNTIIISEEKVKEFSTETVI